MRIASLLPSATEMLFAMGAGDEVVAVTFECDYPAEARKRPQVVSSHMPAGLTPAEIDALVRETGSQGQSLYFADFDLIERLRPDVIVLQDLCRVCAIDSPALARDLCRLPWEPKVVSLGASSLEGVFGEIEMLGDVVGHAQEARALADELRARVRAVREGVLASGYEARPKVLCLEWLDPLFQGGHWVPEMVEIAGGEPVLTPQPDVPGAAGGKSVRITWDQIAEARPDVVIVMPCGYHLEATIAQFREISSSYPQQWHELPALRDGRVYAVDGSAYFSRPGPRLADGVEILRAALSGKGWHELPADSLARLSGAGPLR